MRTTLSTNPGIRHQHTPKQRLVFNRVISKNTGQADVYLGTLDEHHVAIKDPRRQQINDMLEKYGTAAEYNRLRKAHTAAPGQVVTPITTIATDRPDYPIMVMEHIPGFSLQTIMKDAAQDNTPLPLIAVCDIMVEVARGLRLIKTKTGIVHRDIKPQNILVSTTGEVKIIDFGIAKETLSDPLNPDEPEATVAIGTPQYAPPERMEAETHDTSDVFSLGIVAKELLTLQRSENITDLITEQLKQNYRLTNVWAQNISSLLQKMIKAEANERLSLKTTEQAWGDLKIQIIQTLTKEKKYQCSLNQYADEVLAPLYEKIFSMVNDKNDSDSLPSPIDISLPQQLLMMDDSSPTPSLPSDADEKTVIMPKPHIPVPASQHAFGISVLVSFATVMSAAAFMIGGIVYFKPQRQSDVDSAIPTTETLAVAIATPPENSLSTATALETNEILKAESSAKPENSFTQNKTPPAETKTSKAASSKNPRPVTTTPPKKLQEPKNSDAKPAATPPATAALSYPEKKYRAVYVNSKKINDGSKLLPGSYTVRLIDLHGNSREEKINITNTTNTYTLD